jgi:hypothetical protein
VRSQPSGLDEREREAAVRKLSKQKQFSIYFALQKIFVFFVSNIHKVA